MIVTDGGARVALRGAVTIVGPDSQPVGTVTFTPQDDGTTDWHWTHTRDGETFTEEGSGIFLRDEPKPEAEAKPEPEPLPTETAIAQKPVTKKATKVARKKTVAKKIAKKPATKKTVVKKPAAKKPVVKKMAAKKSATKKTTAKKAKKTAAKKPAKKAKAAEKTKKGTRGR